jgi:plastocyanin
MIAAAALGLALGGSAWVPVAAGAAGAEPAAPSTTVVEPTGPADAASAATVTVATSGGTCAYFCFSPSRTTIAAGETVTFTNPTATEHTVKRCTPAACRGASGGTGTDAQFTTKTFALPANGSVSYTFGQPGTYVYFCTLHGYALMHGTITVTAAAPAPALADPVATATAPPSTAVDPNALASTGGSPDPLIATAAALLVVGLAATGLAARGHAERRR